MNSKSKIIARIFEDVGGYYVCDETLPYLDARGKGYRSKAQAMRAARLNGYTHARGSGTYRPGNTVKL